MIRAVTRDCAETATSRGVRRRDRASGASVLRLAVNAMATRFEIVLHGDHEAHLRAAGEAALQEIVDGHRRFTRFTSDSLLAHIMRTAHASPVRLDQDTFDLFSDALDVQHLTGGAFSISLTALPAFSLDPGARSIRLHGGNVRLDLGAIAKGHALDLAARVLRDAGVTTALLHGGTSSVLAVGAPEGSSGWTIAFAHDPALDPVLLRDAALSVSGATGATTASAPRYHIRDARDGRPVMTRRYVTVIGPSARGADAWATAVSILGKRPASMGEEWSVHVCGGDARPRS